MFPFSERTPATGRVSSRCPNWFAPHTLANVANKAYCCQYFRQKFFIKKFLNLYCEMISALYKLDDISHSTSINPLDVIRNCISHNKILTENLKQLGSSMIKPI